MLLEVFNFLQREQKKKIIFLIFIFVVGAFFEMLSIGLLFPAITTLFSGKEYVITTEIFNKFFPQNLISLINAIDEKTLSIYILILLILFFFIKNLFLSYMHYLSHIIMSNIHINFSNNIFKKYSLSEYIFFTNSNKSELIRNIIDEPGICVNRLLLPGAFLISEIITIIFICFLLLFVDYKITIVVFLFCFFIAILFIKIIKKKIILWGEQRQKFSAIRYQDLVEFFNLIIDVKLKKLENYFYKKFQTHNVIHVYADRNVNSINVFHRQFFEILGIFIFCLILIVSIYLDYKLVQVLPVIVIYLAAAFRLLPSINRIVSYSNNLNFGYVAFKKIKSELNNFNSKFDLDDKKNITKISFFKNLKFDNVSFIYQGSKKFIIKNSNFTINKGSFYGIYGPSGSGKSSFLLLLTGLLNPSSGKVIINDKHDINKEPSDFTELFGFVGQTTTLLNATIAENIAFGHDISNFDLNKINKLIEDVNLNDFVQSLPEKINTVIGDNGIRISGGQRQRIAIARALYKNPQFLILDEATSSLDNENENKIIKIIDSLKEKLTIIFISHKFSNLKLCNKIFNLNDGVLAESKLKF
jgi:ABC-type multidrug transport system fused ATPase/permease subunit